MNHQKDKQFQTDTVATLQYMSPESMKQSVYTPASDVYSFGIVAWELLTEEDAFGTKSGFELIDHVVNQKQKPSLDHLAMDHSLRQLIHSCMSYLPDERPSADHICKVLKSLCKKLTSPLSPSLLGN